MCTLFILGDESEISLSSKGWIGYVSSRRTLNPPTASDESGTGIVDNYILEKGLIDEAFATAVVE